MKISYLVTLQWSDGGPRASTYKGTADVPEGTPHSVLRDQVIDAAARDMSVKGPPVVVFLSVERDEM